MEVRFSATVQAKREGIRSGEHMAVYETVEFPAETFADAGRVLTRFGRLVEDMRTEVQAAAAAAVATDEALVTGSGPCHGEHCQHVSHGGIEHFLRTIGRTAHNAYAGQIEPGQDVSFDRLPRHVQDAWIVAAAAVVTASRS